MIVKGRSEETDKKQLGLLKKKTIKILEENKGEPISDTVEEKVDVLLESLEKKLDYLNDKIQYDSLESFTGTALGYDHVTEIIFLAFSIIFTLLQTMSIENKF